MSRGGNRLVRKIAASLAAGVVLTVAVAWGLEARGPMMDTVSVDERPRWPVKAPEGWPDQPNFRSRQVEFGRRHIVAGWRTDDGPGKYGTFIVEFNVSGWPAGAMARSAFGELDATNKFRWTTAHERALPAWLDPRGDRAVPLRVLWPGFAIDTAFFGGIIFVLWSAPGFVRRRSRRRRGLCVVCGYDLRGAAAGAVCPECGAGGRGSARDSG